MLLPADAVPAMQGWWLLGLSGLRPIADRVWDARDWLAPTPMTLGSRVVSGVLGCLRCLRCLRCLGCLGCLVYGVRSEV